MGRRGFTLLEVLLAVLLLTAAFLALSQALSMALVVGGDNENSLTAVNLAQEKMESIRNTSYSGISNETKAAVSGFSPFQREVAVTTPQANLKQVSVIVYWYHKAAEMSYTLVSYVSSF